MIFWNIKKSDVKKLLKIRNQLQFDMNNILAKNEKKSPTGMRRYFNLKNEFLKFTHENKILQD